MFQFPLLANKLSPPWEFPALQGWWIEPPGILRPLPAGFGQPVPPRPEPQLPEPRLELFPGALQVLQRAFLHRRHAWQPSFRARRDRHLPLKLDWLWAVSY